MPVSGTGSAAMESCFVNMIDPGDKVLIIQNGYFGLRMENMCQVKELLIVNQKKK